MHERPLGPGGGVRAKVEGRRCAVRCAVMPQDGGAGLSLLVVLLGHGLGGRTEERGGLVGSWLAMHERPLGPGGGGRAKHEGRRCAVRCAVVPQDGGAGLSLLVVLLGHGLGGRTEERGGLVGSWLAMHERPLGPGGGMGAKHEGRRCAVRCAMVPQDGGAGGSVPPPNCSPLDAIPHMGLR
jgi:hypothetical protein